MAIGTGEPLSQREREVATAYAAGASYKEIARLLAIAPSTVRAHLRTIYRKHGVSSKVGLVEALSGADPTPTTGPSLSRVRVAVLSFINMSDDSAQQYFADGFTEDVITELSRFHQLSVLSTPSAQRLRETAISGRPTRDSAFFVEGSVRRIGGRLRINVRLMEASSGQQLWAERYDREESAIFEVQDEIVQRIAATVAGRIEASMTERARRKLPLSLEAYECVLRGDALGLGDPDIEAEAGQLYQRAIEIDPGYGLAYSKLAHILSLAWFREQSDDMATLDCAFDLAKRAAALDPDEPNVHHVLGWVHLFRRSFDLAERFYRRTLELNPNSAKHTAHLGDLNCFLGNSDEALRLYAKAHQLDPYFVPAHFWRMQGIAHFTANRLPNAVACFCHSPVIPYWVRVYLAAIYALLGEDERATDCVVEILREAPEFSLNRFAAKEPLRRSEDRGRLIEGMREAGLPE